MTKHAAYPMAAASAALQMDGFGVVQNAKVVMGHVAPTPWDSPEAAGVIHSDLQKGFIRAEVIPYHELVSLGSMAEARSKGKLRLEGKEYILHDGDIMHVRFNV